MQIIKSNGYHVPTDTIFSANVRPEECSLTIATGDAFLTFPLPEPQVRPLLVKAGFVAFDNGILVNPKNVAYMIEYETSVVIYGHFGRAVHLYGQENVSRALEMYDPKKKVK